MSEGGIRMVGEHELRKMEESARALGRDIGTGLPSGIGFALLLFEFGEGEWTTYISNAQRPDMIKAIEEMLMVLKSKTDRPPGAEHPPEGESS